MPKRLGLIAGNRLFPIYVARAAKAKGYEVIALGIKEETEAQLETEVDRMHWVSLERIGEVPELLKREGVEELILCGQIKPERLLQGESGFGGIAQQLLRLLPDRSGSSAMRLAVQVLESQGFHVLDSSAFLKDWIPQAGILTQRAPSLEEKQDVTHGIKIARELSRLGIGQTVVLRKGAVVAVEAMEGTDQAILRAGEIAGEGSVVAKACGPSHDMRFDIPVVGLTTIQAMGKARAACLGVEAGRTLLFERPELIAEADRQDLAIVAV